MFAAAKVQHFPETAKLFWQISLLVLKLFEYLR